MESQTTFKGSEDLSVLCQMIRNVYMPMERSRGNVYAMLQNYAKTLKNSVDQVTGSRAIQIPDFIEPDEEKALSDTNTMLEYEEYLVRLLDLKIGD